MSYANSNEKKAAKAAKGKDGGGGGGGGDDGDGGDGDGRRTRQKKETAPPPSFGLPDVSTGLSMKQDRESAALLVSRHARACFPDTSEPDRVYSGVVVTVLDVSQNDEGDTSSIYLTVKFEDGDEHSYTLSELVTYIVPFSEMSKDELMRVRNLALQAELTRVS